MKIKVHLSIGFVGAKHEDVLEISDEELEGLSEEQRETHLLKVTEEWANNYIDCYYEEVSEE